VDQFVTIQQEITAGSDWDGTAPTTTPVVADGVKSFPTDTQGGLFEFGYDAGFMLWQIERIAVDFGGVAVKGIYIRKGAVDIPIYESTLITEIKILVTDKILLAADEQLVITSSGAAAAMYARVTARPALARP